MLNQSFTRPPQQRLAQRGQVVVGLLAILGIGLGATFYTFVSPTGSTIERDKITAAALAQAKEALIGRSVSNNNRPGSLPCPDTNNNGTAEGFSGNECPSYIGRLPWKTLGLPELRDGSGELLWYAVSRNFRDHSSAQPINSDTKGSLTVYSGTTGTIMASEAAAVIFAPGAPLGTQNRSSSTTMACTAPSGTIARDWCAANYLETASTTNNAVAAGPYISAQPTAAFNDRLLVITTADLMTPVERRAAREILDLLQSYRTGSNVWWGCACYPWADISDGSSNTGTYRGRVPLLDADPNNWSSFGISISSWLINNEWWWVFYYAVAPNDTEWHSGGSLTVNGVSGKSVALITTGPAGASRPSSNWNDYLDDAENRNGDNIFITPSSTAYARDRIYTIP